MNSQVIVADTSCLIVLHRINELHLLQQVFGNIKITKEVNKEFGESLPAWIEVVEVKDDEKRKLIGLTLDEGEASSLAYCLEQKTDNLLIIDEKKGRKIARELGIKVTGTLGVIVRAREKSIISSAKDVLEQLEKADFRISTLLKEEILRNAGET